MGYQEILLLGFFALLCAGWLWIKWGESGDDKSAFAEMLVKYAYQKLTDKPGQERFAYVLDKLRARYPKAPVELLEHLIEATVYDVKQNRSWVELEVEEVESDNSSSVKWN